MWEPGKLWVSSQRRAAPRPEVPPPWSAPGVHVASQSLQEPAGLQKSWGPLRGPRARACWPRTAQRHRPDPAALGPSKCSTSGTGASGTLVHLGRVEGVGPWRPAYRAPAAWALARSQGRRTGGKPGREGPRRPSNRTDPSQGLWILHHKRTGARRLRSSHPRSVGIQAKDTDLRDRPHELQGPRG